jgi:hypothetical protein
LCDHRKPIQEIAMCRPLLSLLLGLCLSVMAHAQPPGPPIDLVQELRLSGDQAKKVEAIRQQTRDRIRAAREQERADLAKVLNAQQLAQYDKLMPKPPNGPPPREGNRDGPPPKR